MYADMKEFTCHVTGVTAALYNGGMTYSSDG